MTQPEEEPTWDVRTTPRWLRGPTVIGFSLVVVYLLSCFHYTLQPSPPKWVVAGYWQMFSLLDKSASTVYAEAMVEGSWEAFDLEGMFPTQWESGHRWSRSSFRKSERRMRVLAGAACKRHPASPQRIRVTQQRWQKVLGSREQADLREVQLIDHRCGTVVRLPGGRQQ